MSYQVLARKWRPAKFAELVGQEHVKAALINGLSNQRLHHAYLFTGTRGVGKTTIARIFAKSLNCETGVSAEPCGQCGTCLDVDSGRFVDLIEIDAASRTKVGDTREILDNVQYAPTRGRYKVYLIDEVHMLSRHSFNALLKTLEEPPEHVKFLLATTDPQKLPVTILSRCLQFNLQALSLKQIADQLSKVLQAEQLPFEPQAIELLAKYAKGSMRDGLSLTDQAIAQSDQNVTLGVVQHMMGTVDISWSQNILTAIINHDGDSLVDEFARLTKQSPDISKVLDDLLSVCHQIALTQVMPGASQLNQQISEFIRAVASKISPQEVQVYYQILLQGKRDLTISSDPYSSFEMTCLRMLAFKPATDFSGVEVKKNSNVSAEPLKPVIVKESVETDKATDSSTSIPKAAVSQDSLVTPEPVTPEPVTSESITPELIKPSPTVPEEPAEASQSESELLAQQQFYQSMAQSQGLPSNETQSQVEPVQQSELNDDASNTKTLNPVQQTPEQAASLPPGTNTDLSAPDDTDNEALDNPVLAILAARGFDQSLNPPVAKQSVTEEKMAAPQQADTETLPEEPALTLPDESQLMPIEHEEVRFAHQVDSWASLIERSDLAGRARQLALNASVEINDDNIELVVKQEFAHLLNEKTEAELNDVVTKLAPQCSFVINKSELVEYAPAEIQKDINQNRQQRAEESIQNDPMVTTLINEFDGKIIAGSIKPL